MIVHKVFRQDDSGRKRMEAALKKFFYPGSPLQGKTDPHPGKKKKSDNPPPKSHTAP